MIGDLYLYEDGLVTLAGYVKEAMANGKATCCITNGSKDRFAGCDGREYREGWYNHELVEGALPKERIVGFHYNYVSWSELIPVSVKAYDSLLELNDLLTPMTKELNELRHDVLRLQRQE